MQRESEKYPVGVLIGGRDCGKTTFMRGNRELNIVGFIQTTCMKENLKGAIIVDTMRERKEYADVKKITHPSEYVSGVVHLIVNPETADDYIKFIDNNVKDTFILFEDARKIVPLNISKTAYEALVIDSKNIHCPVWFIYHTYMNVPRGLYSIMDKMLLFKIKQHPSARKSEITNYEEVLEAHEKVQAHHSPYHHETVNNGA